MENNDNIKIKNYNGNTEIFNFSSIKIPEPFEKISNNRQWINWGVDNLYPNYLISLSNKSSLHSSIIKQKAMLIGGKGFNKINLSFEAQLLLKNIYNDEDCDEILFKIAYDLELYGCFYLNLIWNKKGNKIVEINYIDPSKVRIKVPDDTEKYPDIKRFLISDGWENTKKYPITEYQGFSSSYKKEKSQILQVNEYKPGLEWYSIPEYFSGVYWMELEWSISKFHLNNAENSFHPSMHINFPIGQPSSDEQRDVINRLKLQYQGSDRAGNVVVTFSEDKDTAVTMDPIELNASDSRFLMLNDQVTDGILNAHRVTSPTLFGINIPGSLGDKNHMIESMELFTTQYVEPKQRIIEKIFNKIARINRLPDTFIINKYEPSFSKVTTNMGDIITLLSSALTPQQKYYMLLANDYDHITAANLSAYHDGNNLKNISNTSKINPNTNE